MSLHNSEPGRTRHSKLSRRHVRFRTRAVRDWTTLPTSVRSPHQTVRRKFAAETDAQNRADSATRRPSPDTHWGPNSGGTAPFFARFLVETQPLKCGWRPEPESNRRARICSPLRNHSAIGPWNGASVEARPPLTGGSPHRQEATRSAAGHWSFDQRQLAQRFPADKNGPGARLQHRSGRALNFRCIIGIQQQ